MFDKIKIISLFLTLILSSCTYLKYTAIQKEYEKLQDSDPSQVNLKHMLEKETFFVWGKPIDEANQYSNTSMAIAAYSSKFKENERVDTMFFKGGGTHYGLNLPNGDYTLLVYADIDNNKIFDTTEIIGVRQLDIDINKHPDKVVKFIEVKLTSPINVSWADIISPPKTAELTHSLYFPTGSIRSLDDSIFDERISTMGMYDPASFMNHAPTMFYAEEENTQHKIPVVFVHGIGGSSRSFTPIIEKMDKNHYRRWFFYYPSGGDLDQLADFFYSLFLSGDVIPLGDMPLIIVAHSMGGLVVREALNKYEGKTQENRVELFVTIASPLGGHPAAASGEKHGLIVLPSWRDLNPNSTFITELYRNPLPEFTKYQLIYAYKNSSKLKSGDNSDGVVPLFSQLHPPAQKEAQEQFGFNSGHDDILHNSEMINHLIKSMAEIEGLFPESHMNLLIDGGFDVQLGEDYGPETQHLINYAGKYLVLLANDFIAPINTQQAQFIHVIQNKIPATKDIEKEFIRFMEEYPDIINTALEEADF